MKVYKVEEKRNGKKIIRFKANLTKREGIELLKLGGSFELVDVDRHGEVFFKVKKCHDYGVLDPKTSFNVYDRGVLVGFKGWCRGRGLSMCSVLNSFMEGVVEGERHLADVGGVKIVNVFLGRPRSRKKRRVWSSEFVGGKERQRDG